MKDVVYAFNPSQVEVETGESLRVLGQPELHSETSFKKQKSKACAKF